jgi:sialidase-1
MSWQDQEFIPELVEPICQASIRRYSWSDPGILLFSNPADRDKRIKLTIKVSKDDGRSWEPGLELTNGPSAYSDLAVLTDNSIACLYECGSEHPYETITFARLNLKQLNFNN